MNGTDETKRLDTRWRERWPTASKMIYGLGALIVVLLIAFGGTVWGRTSANAIEIKVNADEANGRETRIQLLEQSTKHIEDHLRVISEKLDEALRR